MDLVLRFDRARNITPVYHSRPWLSDMSQLGGAPVGSLRALAVARVVSSDRRAQGAPIGEQEVVSSGRPAIKETHGDGNSDRFSSGGRGLREGSGRWRARPLSFNSASY